MHTGPNMEMVKGTPKQLAMDFNFLPWWVGQTLGDLGGDHVEGLESVYLSLGDHHMHGESLVLAHTHPSDPWVTPQAAASPRSR